MPLAVFHSAPNNSEKPLHSDTKNARDPGSVVAQTYSDDSCHIYPY